MTARLILAKSYPWSGQLRFLSLSAGLRGPPQSDMSGGSGQGGSGSVRDSGGAFSKREIAFENQYFRKVTDEQLELLHDHHVEGIVYLERSIKDHLEAIEKSKLKLKLLRQIMEQEKHRHET